MYCVLGWRTGCVLCMGLEDRVCIVHGLEDRMCVLCSELEDRVCTVF